jgi:hypothetical protein
MVAGRFYPCGRFIPSSELAKDPAAAANNPFPAVKHLTDRTNKVASKATPPTPTPPTASAAERPGPWAAWTDDAGNHPTRARADPGT